MFRGWADVSFVSQSHHMPVCNSHSPKRTHLRQEKKPVPWEQARRRPMCRFSTVGAWQHVCKRPSEEPSLSGALRSSFSSAELLICFFWQQNLPMCELRRPRQMNSDRSARLPGQLVCWGVTGTYWTGKADYHCPAQSKFYPTCKSPLIPAGF